MQTTAQTAGLLLSAPLFAGATANRCATPNPIPGGFQFFGPGTEVFHNSAPGVFDPLDTDPSGITDFNGQIGYAVIDGTGTQTDASGEQQLGFEVDIRFMQGEYVAVDGKHYERTFGFL